LLTAWELSVVHAVDGAILGALLGYMLALLVLMRGAGRQSYCQQIVPIRPLRIGAAAAYAVAFLLLAVIGYVLPGGGPEAPPFRVLTLFLTAFGLLWLPAISLVVGWTFTLRLFREEG
jgi:hypothetical protein